MGSIDWQINKAPLECTKYLLENEINCDVTFRIGEDPESIKAHKLILSMRSPVFDRMLNGSFCESKKDPVIPDVTPAAFRAILRYCYYECVDIEDDEALSILYSSTKYMLPVLEKAARKKLKKVLGRSNVWEIYRYAISVGDVQLHKACKMYFQRGICAVREVLQDAAFLNIPHQVLLDFLHINDNADKVDSKEDSEDRFVPFMNNVGISVAEIELFTACNVWAEAECLRQEMDPTGANKRTVLGECLFLLRLPTVYYKDLVNVVYTTGILTQTEKDNLCLYKHRDPGSHCQVDFPMREREFLVTTPMTNHHNPYQRKSTVFVESKVRVILSKLWVRGAGSHTITVTDKTSGDSWSKNCDTVDQPYCTKKIMDECRLLYTLDFKPRLLEPGTKYSVTVAEKKKSDHGTDPILVPKWSMVGKLEFQEIKVTSVPDEISSMYALTLCLV